MDWVFARFRGFLCSSIQTIEQAKLTYNWSTNDPNQVPYSGVKLVTFEP